MGPRNRGIFIRVIREIRGHAPRQVETLSRTAVPNQMNWHRISIIVVVTFALGMASGCSTAPRNAQFPSDYAVVAYVDSLDDLAKHIVRDVLQRHGINPLIMGHVIDRVYVPNKFAARARELLKNDALAKAVRIEMAP